MTTDWLLRVGDGKNFISSSVYRIWGIQTKTSLHGKHFIENVKPAFLNILLNFLQITGSNPYIYNKLYYFI
jgi:hypothetical protein